MGLGWQRCVEVWRTLAVASHAPETKILTLIGEGEIDITSPLWSEYCCSFWPLSTSHSMHVISPEEVRILFPFEEMKRQQER